MKKLLLLLVLCVAIVATLVACGNDPVTSTDATTQAPDTTTTPGQDTEDTSSADETTSTTPTGTTDEFGNNSLNIVNPEYVENGFTYVIFDDGAKLVSYNGSATEVTVPAEVLGKTVKYIATAAFFEQETVTKITLSAGVTTLGNDVFYGCRALTDVTLPSTITKIGDGAFRFCVSVPKVVIPDSVVSLGNDTFFECRALSDVTLPQGLTFIPRETFYNCFSLGSITLPSSVNMISEKAFYYCTGLTEFNFDNITAIGEKAFYNCSSLKSVKLPESIVAVPKHTFFNCTSLETLTLGSKTNLIGAYAFYNCQALTAINLPESVTSIATGAFAYCSGVTGITLPSEIKSISDRAFYKCSSLKNVIMADDLVSIGEDAFAYSALEKVVIPASLTTVGHSAFAYCEKLTTVEFEDGAVISALGQMTFANCTALKSITLPDSLTVLNNGAFHTCTALESVTLSPYTTKIALNTFVNCAALKEITLPDSIKEIGRNSVGINLDGNIATYNGVTKIYAFDGGAVGNFLNSSKIPYESLGASGFVPYTELEAELINTDEKTYRITKYLGDATVIAINKKYKDGIVTEIGANFLKGNTDVTKVTLPDSITAIGAHAFDGCTSLTKITDPLKITTVAPYAFNGTAITALKLGTSVDKIGEYAFAGTKITSFTVPTAVTEIGASAFEGSLIRLISIPRSVTKIDDRAFANCSLLTGITLVGEAPTIGKDVIANTTPITAFHYSTGNAASFNITDGKWAGYPATDASMSDAFKKFNVVEGEGENEKILVNIELRYNGTLNISGVAAAGALMPDYASLADVPWAEYKPYISTVAVTKIRHLAAYSLAELPLITTISLPSELQSIGDYALANTPLTTLNTTNTANLATLGKGFVSGTNIASIILPSKVTVIPEEAFLDCLNLAEVTIQGKPTEIGAKAFMNTSVKLLSMPDTLLKIGDDAFKNCKALTAITTFATHIGNSAFEGCELLSSLVCSGDIVEIGNASFKGTALSKANFKATLDKIGDEAFANCPNLVEITLTGDAPVIGTGVLDNTPAYAHFFYYDEEKFVDKYQVENGLWNGLYKATCSTTNVLASFKVDGGTVDILYNYTLKVTPDVAGTRVKIGSYASADDSPWAAYRDYVRTINLTGVSEIGAYAFAGFVSLSKIDVPATVSAVGAHAFEGCTGATAVTLYAKSIGDEAFAGCSKLVNATLDGTEVFGVRAFADCVLLENVTITSPTGATSAAAANAFDNTLYNSKM